MSALRLFLLAPLCISSTTWAQVQPVPGTGDPHLQSIDYDASQIVQLRGAPGYQLMVELSPDEQIQSVALGDSGAWQVSINKAGDRLFLKPAQAYAETNMTVVTSVRVYNFELFGMSGPSSDMPYTVQFRYPDAGRFLPRLDAADAGAKGQRTYRISGSKLLRPVWVEDDGQRTYVSWPKGSPIPAVYAPDRFGNEVLVNGMMGTDDVFVIDGTPLRLTFRIDKTIARAERIARKGQ